MGSGIEIGFFISSGQSLPNELAFRVELGIRFIFYMLSESG